MAKPTHDEIIRQHSMDIATLYERVKSQAAQFEALDSQLKELKGELKEASKLRWSLVPPIVGAVVSGIIAALVAYFIARK